MAITLAVSAGLGAGTDHGGATGLRPAAIDSTSRGAWRWPLQGVALTRPFEAPATPYSAGHRGVDLRAAPGAAVSAPSDAVVHFSGVVVDRPVLTLDHGDGVLSSYEPVRSELKAGDSVAVGGSVGVVSTGGHCNEACLHVGVRVYGEYVSPLLYFDRVPRAVLLPLGSGSGR
ncbi:peptidoglycan DD-metalloendopeptidase family protein [Leifsonia poae]|uniref:peptidoglycan DD-metalloendopeptidase family protein n=1 Tax=Leifsonia poae TaxID=110933 RepID=UPI0022F281E5|nr:peptidoglycan DD-metalloendopeptidase family protein [Leifsonia poae]